jgi:N-carbamoyl-L-amino-acid hydrolase
MLKTMNRRKFIHGYSRLIVAFSFFPIQTIYQQSIGVNNSQIEVLVDGHRLNDTLSHLKKFGRNVYGGIDRIAFSEADREARWYVINLMKKAGLVMSIDQAANIIGRRNGTEKDLSPLILGSHIDSVPGGGNYDGQIGSLCAIEVAQILADNNISTRHAIEVVIFTNEEGGKTGSRCMANGIEPFELDLITASGLTIGEGILANGGDPYKLEEVKRKEGSVAGYLELHIEQGSILDHKKIQIGVVEGIVGIRRWNVTVVGKTNHAGTTPMADRKDSLVAAAVFIQEVNKITRKMVGKQVATIGKIESKPGVPNVIPGKTLLTLEIRDLEMGKINKLFKEIVNKSKEISKDYGPKFSFDQFYISRAAPTDKQFRNVIEQTATGLGLSVLRMPSGAGHDAQSIALFAPVGMIFVPSVDGISHSPKEFTRPKDIEAGANVLLHSLLKLDAILR